MTATTEFAGSTSSAARGRATLAQAESRGQRFIDAAQRIANSDVFQWGVIAVILLGAFLVAMETDAAFVAENAELLVVGNLLVQIIFTAEVSLRWLAHGRNQAAFLRDGWNAFDLAIVTLGWIPAVGPMAVLGRVVRIVRVLRLASFSPKLRLILDAVVRSLPSLGHVGLLIGLLVFAYSILGVMLFGSAQPEKWGSLGDAALNVFQLLTMEGWTGLMAPLLETSPWAWIYFLSFIIFGGLIIVNLFVGVVLDNMQGARAEAEAAELRAAAEQADSLAQARLELHQLSQQLARVQMLLDMSAADQRTAQHRPE
jgi:voltage-gated sodium channel